MENKEQVPEVEKKSTLNRCFSFYLFSYSLETKQKGILP